MGYVNFLFIQTIRHMNLNVCSTPGRGTPLNFRRYVPLEGPLFEQNVRTKGVKILENSVQMQRGLISQRCEKIIKNYENQSKFGSFLSQFK